MEHTEVQLDAPSDLFEGAATPAVELPDEQLRAVVEAVIYVTDEPLTADQIATALQQPAAKIGRVLEELTAEYNKPEHGLTIREVAGGYKMSTKPEHHEAIHTFVKNLKPPLKLSLAALETLALIAYKQPITAPEVMEVRGVQGAGVLKTLIDRKAGGYRGQKSCAWQAHPVQDHQGIPGAVWVEGSERAADPEGIRGAWPAVHGR